MASQQQKLIAADTRTDKPEDKTIHLSHSIRLVKQRDSTGCGIACVAALANVRYYDAKQVLIKIMRWTPRRKYFYTRTKELLSLLQQYDIEAHIKRSSCWKDIKGTAIVGVDRDGSGIFHWVVVIRDKGRFLMIDPRAGEVFNGPTVIARDDSYDHGHCPSNYISVNRCITSITI